MNTRWDKKLFINVSAEWFSDLPAGEAVHPCQETHETWLTSFPVLRAWISEGGGGVTLPAESTRLPVPAAVANLVLELSQTKSYFFSAYNNKLY